MYHIATFVIFAFVLGVSKSITGLLIAMMLNNTPLKLERNQTTRRYMNLAQQLKITKLVKFFYIVFSTVIVNFEFLNFADFYKQPTLVETFDEDINDAFEEMCVQSSESGKNNDWPWEIHNTTTNLSNVPSQYGSLKEGNWVEDEVLEKAIKIIISQNGLEPTHTFLESYVMKFGAKKTYEDGMLQR